MEFMTDKKGEGYQKDQVDAYIRELRQTYQQMYEAYQAMQRQSGELERRCADLQRKLQSLEAETQTLRQQAQMYPQANAPGAGMQYPAYQQYAAQYGAPYGAQANAPQPGLAPSMPYGYY